MKKAMCILLFATILFGIFGITQAVATSDKNWDTIAEDIDVITNRVVRYIKTNEMLQFEFAFQDKHGDYITPPMDVAISILGNKNEVLYSGTFSVTPNDYRESNYREREESLSCIVEVPVETITKTRGQKFVASVSYKQIVSFEPWTHPLNWCSLLIPKTPFLADSDFLTEVSSLFYQFGYTDGGNLGLWIYFSGSSATDYIRLEPALYIGDVDHFAQRRIDKELIFRREGGAFDGSTARAFFIVEPLTDYWLIFESMLN